MSSPYYYTDMFLPHFKEKLKELLSRDLARAFTALHLVISKKSDHYNEIIQLKARHQSAKKDHRQNLISTEDRNRVFDQVRVALLSVTDELNPEDVDFDALNSEELNNLLTERSGQTGRGSRWLEMLRTIRDFYKASPVLWVIPILILLSLGLIIRQAVKSGTREKPPIINLTAKADSTLLRGNVKDKHGDLMIASIVDVDGLRTKTDSLGDFSLLVPGKSGKSIRLRVFNDQGERHSSEETLSETFLQIQLK